MGLITGLVNATCLVSVPGGVLKYMMSAKRNLGIDERFF